MSSMSRPIRTLVLVGITSLSLIAPHLLGLGAAHATTGGTPPAPTLRPQDAVQAKVPEKEISLPEVKDTAHTLLQRATGQQPDAPEIVSPSHYCHPDDAGCAVHLILHMVSHYADEAEQAFWSLYWYVYETVFCVGIPGDPLPCVNIP